MSGPAHVLHQAVLRGTIRKPSRADLGGLVARAFAVLATWRARSAERATLATMDARELQDMGLTRADAATELRKPFWRA